MKKEQQTGNVFSAKPAGAEGKESVVTPPSQAGETQLYRRPVGSTPRRRAIPEGLWTKCRRCGELIFDKDLEANLKICTHCDYHFPLGARDRIRSIVAPDSFVEMDENMSSVDILEFPDYPKKLATNQKKTGMKDAVITGVGDLLRHRVALGVMDFSFNGGSMGSVVGEKLTRLIERGTQDRLPVIIFASSGGARMYEGMFSLMQMAKTCGALAYHSSQRLAFISVLTDPTMAGVMASFASVGDLILAEPAARIGFAGPRVIRDTTQSDLPSGFQTSEFLEERGLIDAIVPRKEMKDRLAYYLDFIGNEAQATG
ncbi:MAG: acetyl-CoA carboxylase carboxyltransferase subunit beta [Verrucomicrobia bacterium]|jgi:acetyl-CoA carboxylase carboxyl transferase subunit beta|nr:acetyl-CoA carboxylase carboxyltransferase subunit beta [Verrucomicrobiota bacterium]MDB4746562.1 acetyl-CoA carboxylase, carboxyltransferase subunit beta [Verrucomicrobiota bacterium]